MSEDTKLTELIINTLSPEQFEPITPSDTEIYLVEDDAEYATVEELATKQDVINDLADIRIGASKGATAIQQAQLEAYHDNTKQNTISDLSTIRTNASNSVQYGTSTNKGLYLSTHPELGNNSIIIPFIHNDIAFFNKKGGTLTFARRTENGEFEEYIQSDADNIVNGKPDYCKPDPRGYYEFQITLELNKKYNYNNIVYIDFGISNMIPDQIKLEYKLQGGDWTTHTQIDDNKKTVYYTVISGGGTGIIGLRFTLRPLNRTGQYNFRIAQIGLINYDSQGSNSTLLGLGGGTLYGDVNFASGKLVDYVKNTDYATSLTAGLVRASSMPYATTMDGAYIAASPKTKEQYKSGSQYMFISKATLENIKEDLVTSVGDGKYAKADELNNPYSLLDSKYSDHKLYNASWLIANGSYNGKRTIHKSAYELLLKLYNGTEIIEGISVKAVGDSTITDYDFVIDIENEQFKLPIKTKLASGSAVVGNGMTLGITDGTTNGGLQAKGYTPAGFIANPLQAGTSRYGTSIGSDITNDQMSGKTLGIATDGTKSGIETDSTGLYLYFYVGETVQNASLVDVGRIEEQLAGLTTVVKKYTNGRSGYRIWSDGYCEQWGSWGTNNSGWTQYDVTFLKTFADLNYNLFLQGNWSDASSSSCKVLARSVSGFTGSNANNQYAIMPSIWQASGYLASGEY